MDKSTAPVFVLGCARSGTTLLYSIITSGDEFPKYEAESRIVECASRYGSLAKRSNVAAFFEDFSRSRQFVRSGLSRSELAEMVASSNSYTALLGRFMEAIAARQGKVRWAEKTPNNILFVDQLARSLPNAQFVHVVRDGRDVALSQRRLGWMARFSRDPLIQLLWGGKIWERLVRIMNSRKSFLGDRFYQVRYEDLVTQPVATLEGLSQFLGARLDPTIIERSDVGALGKSNSAFGRRESGISEFAAGRWRQQLTPTELGLTDWALGPTLEMFGYERTLNANAPRRASRIRLLKLGIPWMLRGKHFINQHTPLGKRSRKPLEIGLQ